MYFGWQSFAKVRLSYMIIEKYQYQSWLSVSIYPNFISQYMFEVPFIWFEFVLVIFFWWFWISKHKDIECLLDPSLIWTSSLKAVHIYPCHKPCLLLETIISSVQSFHWQTLTFISWFHLQIKNIFDIWYSWNNALWNTRNLHGLQPFYP